MPRFVISLNDAVVREIVLEHGRTSMGRRPYNNIVLEHPTTSGEHAAVQVDDDSVTIEDLGSTNGTYVNGVRVQRQKLAANDIVELGKYQLEYFEDDGLPATAPARGHERARLRIVNGDAQGRELLLNKPVVTLGKPGVSVVSITRKRQGYQLALVIGDLIPEVNGVSVADGPILLCNRDRIVIGETQLEYLDE